MLKVGALLAALVLFINWVGFQVGFKPRLSQTKLKRAVYLLNLVPNEKYKVKYVIDGDTIVIDTGDRIRFLGIDTPELHSSDTAKRDLAYQAKSLTSKLLSGKTIYTKRDISNVDKYGRLLRYVFLDKNDLNDIKKSVNYRLVRQGYAMTLTIPPNLTYVQIFKQAQQLARIEGEGLWATDHKTK